ncbi:MAG: hypothetical protein ACRC0X_09265 [Brevinema sp.]
MKRILSVSLLLVMTSVTAFAYSGRCSNHTLGDGTSHNRGYGRHDGGYGRSNQEYGRRHNNTERIRSITSQQLSVAQQNRLQDIQAKYDKDRQAIDQKYASQEINLRTEINKIEIQMNNTSDDTVYNQLITKMENLRIQSQELWMKKRNEIQELSLNRDKEINQIYAQ